MKRFEKIFLIAFGVLCTTVMLLAELKLPMYTNDTPAQFKWGSGIFGFVCAVYISIRIKLNDGNKEYKWYNLLLGLLTYTVIGGLLTLVMVAKTDLIVGVLIKGTTDAELNISKIEKVVKKKSGFIGGEADVLIHNTPVTLQTGREAYFLIKDKKHIKVRMGKSYLNNYYVTFIYSTVQEKDAASKAYWSSWWHRNWFLVCLFGFIFLAIVAPLLMDWLKGDTQKTTHSSYTKTTYFRNR